MNLTEVRSSDNTGSVSETVPCQTITSHDQNTTIIASQVIIACGTGLFYLVIFALGILGVCVRSGAQLCSSQGTFFVFFIGALVASVNVFTNSDNLEVNLYFRASTVSIIGIAFVFFGAFSLFALPRERANERTLGDQQPSMGCVVGSITFVLFLLETMLLVLALTEETKRETDPTLWKLIIAVKSAFLLQKPIQVGIYLYLRSTTLRMEEYKRNAEFYFRILSFFNLIEWLDAQVNVDNDVQLSGPIIQKLAGWIDVFVVFYKALIIDYRLLCCLLFLEHSVEIGNEDPDDDVESHENEARYINCMTARDRLKMYGGGFVGCLCLTAPVFCGLYYLDSVHIGASIHILAIIVNFAIIVFGALLLFKNDLEEGGIKESLGVKIMVCCLGAVGLICWLVIAAIAGYWAATAADRNDLDGDEPAYMGWNAAKFSVRGLTAAFFMFLLMKTNARALPLKNPTKKINHFVIPVVMLGIFSMCSDCLLDQYAGSLESTLRCEIKEESLKILLEAGPPMYLGFLIHLFLHFFIIWLNLGKRAENSFQDSSADFDMCSSQSYVSFRDPETSSRE